MRNCKKKLKKKKAKRGQPTKYKKKFCQMLIDFFDCEPFDKIELPHYQKDGKTLKWMDYKITPARMPSLIKFAKKIGVGYRTLYDWIDEKHNSYQPEFSQAYMHAKELRKEWLIDLGLSGFTPPQSFKFVAVNVTDMRDRQETNLTGVIGTREMTKVEVREYLQDKRINCDDAIAS